MACYGAGTGNTSNTMGSSGASGLSQSPFGMGNSISDYTQTNDQSMGLDELGSQYADVNKGDKSNTDWKELLKKGLTEAATTQLTDILPSEPTKFSTQGNYTDWQNPQKIQSTPYQWGYSAGNPFYSPAMKNMYQESRSI